MIANEELECKHFFVGFFFSLFEIFFKIIF